MNPARMLQFFDTRATRNEPLVLATVFETRGSTYSKAGAHMLIDGNGIFQGMLSGGCLEGDLAIRAQVVLESDRPQTVTYDLGQDDDEVWGLGVGCDGLMRVFLQTIRHETNYEPFATISAVLRGASNCVAAMVIESTSPRFSVGAGVLVQEDHVELTGLDHGPDAEISAITANARAALSKRHTETQSIQAGDGNIVVLHSYVETPPQILILGAGPDAEPVVRFAAELGWRCTVVDHRQAYIDNGDFSEAVGTRCVAADSLSDKLDLATFDMAVVMSHHLVSDRSYLRQLASTDICYIGLLGPANRRERLLAELGGAAENLQGRLKGPAGLDIGGRGPAPIALSIVVQMQMELQRQHH